MFNYNNKYNPNRQEVKSEKGRIETRKHDLGGQELLKWKEILKAILNSM